MGILKPKAVSSRVFLIIILSFLSGFLLCACDDNGSSGKKNESGAQATISWYKDADGDGYGDPGVSLSQKSQPSDYVDNSGDCSDFDADVHPDAPELCDGKDNNCNGQIDENACQDFRISISGALQNLESAKTYFMPDSYFQLVSMPADGMPQFTSDSQDRMLFNSDLPSIDVPATESFSIGLQNLQPGRYVIAVQLIRAYEAGSDLIPILVRGDGKSSVIEIPDGYSTPLTIRLGDVYLPVPEATISAVTSSSLDCPSEVSATDGMYGDKVVVNWNESAGAASYEVYRAGPFENSGSFESGEMIASTAGLRYEDTDVVCGSIYFYWVLARDPSGLSERCQIDSGYSQCPPPPVPTGVSATDGTLTDAIRVTWNGSQGALSYDVYRSTMITGDKTWIKTTADTSIADGSALCEKDYYYWVTAGNKWAESQYSDPDAGYSECPEVQEPSSPGAGSPGQTVLSIPTGVSATDGQYPNKIVVKWNSVSGAASYDVYRAKEDCDPKILIGSTSGLSIEDTSVPDKSIYYYWVKAANALMTSEFSIKYDTGYLMKRPPFPTGISATDGVYLNRIQVSWKKVPTATSYEVYRANFNRFDLTSWFTREKIATTAGTSISDTDIPCSTSDSPVYYYWVKALNPAGESELGLRDTGYAYRTPKDPSNVYASNGLLECCVEITWSKSARAAAYDIYRATAADGEKIKIASVKGDQTNYFDSSVTCPNEYYYWVRARDAKGYSSCIRGEGDTGYCAGGLN